MTTHVLYHDACAGGSTREKPGGDYRQTRLIGGACRTSAPSERPRGGSGSAGAPQPRHSRASGSAARPQYSHR